MEVRVFGYSDDEDHSPVQKTDLLFFAFYAIVLFIFKIKKDQPFNRKKTRENHLYGGKEMLKPLLEEFLKVEGVSAAVVVGRDGFVIESAVSGKVDIEALGAMASTGLGTSEAMGNTLGKGELSQMLVELEKGPIILSPLSVDELIAIVADTTANIGRIRYELKKNKVRLIAAL
jgi:predicted regulator of Ras-like GTPase activity (Roadblock/LC7/MglB family)